MAIKQLLHYQHWFRWQSTPSLHINWSFHHLWHWMAYNCADVPLRNYSLTHNWSLSYQPLPLPLPLPLQFQ